MPGILTISRLLLHFDLCGSLQFLKIFRKGYYSKVGLRNEFRFLFPHRLMAGPSDPFVSEKIYVSYIKPVCS